MGALKVLSLTSNAASDAASNTSRIQALLNAGGDLAIIGSGDIYINNTLVISGRTKLSVPSDLKLKQLSGTNKKLLTNAAVNAAFATVAVSWMAGVSASVAWTAHGLSKGDMVWLRGVAGTAQSQYSGVFQVTAITDANNFVVRLRRRPTAAPAGTFECKRCDVDITIEGGIWDYNVAENSAATGLETMGMVFGAVHGLNLSNFEGRNCRKYVVCLGAVSDFRLIGMHSPSTGSDGVKVYGPAFDGVVDGLTGYFNDDVCSIQPQEAAPYAQYDFTGGGDTINVVMRNINALSENASLAVLYGATNQFADNILIENIAGKSSSSAVRLTNGSGFNGCLIGQVDVKNIEWQDDRNGALITVSGSQSFRALNIAGILSDPAIAMPSFTSEIIFVGSGVSGHMFRVSGIRTFLGVGATALTLSAAGFSEIVFENNSIMGSSSGTAISITGAGAGARKLDFRNNRIASISQGIVVASTAAATSHFIFEANDANCSSALVNPSVACKISLRDNRLSTMGNGVVRASGAVAISVFSDGNSLESGSWLTISGGSLVSVFGNDFQADVTAIQRTNGSFLFNTNAAAGTLAAVGRVTCQGTAANSWRLLGDPLLRY